jgi:hypothetical protein
MEFFNRALLVATPGLPDMRFFCIHETKRIPKAFIAFAAAGIVTSGNFRIASFI